MGEAKSFISGESHGSAPPNQHRAQLPQLNAAPMTKSVTDFVVAAIMLDPPKP